MVRTNHHPNLFWFLLGEKYNHPCAHQACIYFVCVAMAVPNPDMMIVDQVGVNGDDAAACGDGDDTAMLEQLNAAVSARDRVEPEDGAT